MAESLLRTKLKIPPLRPKLVQRPVLDEKLRQSLQPALKLALICAPAGFGKTTVAASFAANCAIPAAWLSLDSRDNQEDSFLRYLAAALQTADENTGRDAQQLLAAPQPARPQAVLTSLINDLQKAQAPIVLVLDDYQAVSQRAIHEALAFLLEYSPESFHLLIVTRSDPLLPLSRLRARGQMVELRAADLRFSEAETAQFLNEVMNLNLDARAIALLEERTEGWIAGLQMAALSMGARDDVQGFIAGFSGTNRFILDYLLEEVLASQPPEIKHFLLHTAILEQLSAPLCAALLAADGIHPPGAGDRPAAHLPAHQQAAAILAQLERANLFLLPLDDERTWYRYHHLFADLLRAQLQRSQPALVPRLHERAAAWLEAQGYIGEAIHHLIAARALVQAADLIERCGPARLAGGDPSVMQMAGSLPQEMILARPKIGLYLAWLLIVQGRIDAAIPLLQELATRLAGQSPPGDRWLQTVVSLALAFLFPEPDPDGRNPFPSRSLLDEIPAEELVLRNAANFLYAMALDRRGELDRAVEFATACLEQEQQNEKSPGIPTLAPYLSRAYLRQGRLRAAAALCREVLDPLKKDDFRLTVTTGSMKIDLGEVLYEWNRLDEAERLIRAGLQDNEPWGNIMTDSFGLSALRRVLQAKGDYAGALQIVEIFARRLHDQRRPREFEAELHSARVQVQLAGGDLQSAAHWANQVQRSAAYETPEAGTRLTLARIRLAQGRYAAVEQILAGQAPPPTTGSRIARQLETTLLLAAAAAGQQHRQQALELFASCLATAEPEGYIQVFLDLGQPIHELLAATIRSAAGTHQPYAQAIWAAFSQSHSSGPAAPAAQSLVESLTERELEVLRIIAQGRTNREIAAQLVIAPGTVKAHAASIYGKLGVSSRTAAVARARELGLLS